MLPLTAIAAADSALTPARAAALGAIQGLTEFLPVSSSAHLFVVPKLLGWGYAGLAFDVALHGGTLLALVLAFWRDWLRLLTNAVAGEPEPRAAARHLWLWLVLATIPGAVAGKLLEGAAEEHLRSLPLQAAMLFLFGLLLWLVDRYARGNRDATRPGFGSAAIMGCAQALALVPGVSRSGVTITAGRACGFNRVSAARLSFLLATPITFGAFVLEMRHGVAGVSRGALFAGMLTSTVVGFLAIRGLLRWLEHAGFGLFFLYRAALALVIVAFSSRA